MRIFTILLITTWSVAGCREQSNSHSLISQDTAQYKTNTPSVTVPKEAGETNCDFKDGIHSATVDYFNPKTKHTAKYELNVHVKDCQIVQIDFPNGGKLDESHISQKPINGNREAELQDDKGRQWKIHLH